MNKDLFQVKFQVRIDIRINECQQCIAQGKERNMYERFKTLSLSDFSGVGQGYPIDNTSFWLQIMNYWHFFKGRKFRIPRPTLGCSKIEALGICEGHHYLWYHLGLHQKGQRFVPIVCFQLRFSAFMCLICFESRA